LLKEKWQNVLAFRGDKKLPRVDTGNISTGTFCWDRFSWMNQKIKGMDQILTFSGRG